MGDGAEVLEWVSKLGVAGLALWMLHWAKGIIEKMIEVDRASRDDMKEKLFNSITAAAAVNTEQSAALTRVEQKINDLDEGMKELRARVKSAEDRLLSNANKS